MKSIARPLGWSGIESGRTPMTEVIAGKLFMTLTNTRRAAAVRPLMPVPDQSCRRRAPSPPPAGLGAVRAVDRLAAGSRTRGSGFGFGLATAVKVSRPAGADSGLGAAGATAAGA